MTQVDLTYNGITRTPSDFACKDGDLAECVNLLPENGELQPICSPEFLLQCNGELLFIHKGNSYRNYIVNQDGLLKAFKKTEASLEYYSFSMNIASLGRISNISCLGNTLILSYEEGLYYLLFKDDNYKLLGQKPPFIPLSFGLKGTLIQSEKFKFDIEQQSRVTSGIQSLTENNIVKVSNEVMPRVNKFINEKSTSVDKFIFPFFARYAFRLYDNSLIMHSAPILMIPSTIMAPIPVTDTTILNSNYITALEIQLKAFACTLAYQYTGNDLTTQEINKWEDIVKSIDIFISEPIYTYEQESKCSSLNHDFLLGYYGILNLDNQKENGEYVYQKNYIPANTIFSCATLLPSNKKSIREKIENCALFYKAASINIKDISSQRVDLPIKEGTLSTLQLQERMSDDYSSHHALQAKYSYVYNSRLNITNISQLLFQGFPAEAIGCYANKQSGITDKDGYNINIYTFIKENEKEIVLLSYSNLKLTEFPQYLYYPSVNAYKMVITKTKGAETKYVEVLLSKHNNLNGAYFFNFFEQLAWTDSYDTSKLIPSENREIPFPNKIFTSEVNNPFSFPVSGINTLGVGEILGIASATKALSQGQFGQFPLYAFTNEGVWALEVSSTGTYSSKQVVTRDVCNNPNSITQIDGAIIFTTDRGVMILQGSETRCISDIMMGKHFRSDSLEAVHAYKADIDNIIVDISDNLSFSEYIRDCSIAYDYPNARLIFNNPQTRYQYIYSLRPGTFCKLHHGKIFPRVLNSYPDCYLQDTGGNVYNYSDIQDENSITERLPGLVITRPLSFGSTSLKTITRILNRGIYKQPSYVKIGLYGSRDGVTYYKIHSLHGMGWKYFRLVLYTSLLPTERLSCTSFILEERFTNKLR